MCRIGVSSLWEKRPQQACGSWSTAPDSPGLGLLASALAARLIQGLLFGVPQQDPVTFVAGMVPFAALRVTTLLQHLLGGRSVADWSGPPAR
jgi:hypothetical protein